MPVSKKPTKKYAPARREMAALPPNWRYSSESSLALKLVPHISMEEFVRKRGTRMDWDTVTFRLHFGLELAKRHHRSILEEMTQAVVSIILVLERFLATKSWVMNETEISLIGAGLCYTDDMQDMCTRLAQKEAADSMVKANAKQLWRIGMYDRLAGTRA